jgi:hypothetical protein
LNHVCHFHQEKLDAIDRKRICPNFVKHVFGAFKLIEAEHLIPLCTTKCPPLYKVIECVCYLLDGE